MSFHSFRIAAITLLGAFILLSGVQTASACNSQTGCYGALAAGIWNDSNGRARVASGSSYNDSSQIEANNDAMRSCNNRGYNCKVVSTFKNGGCGFISLGNSYGGVSWGTSSTRAGAIRKCQEGGYDCDAPIGGCTAGEVLGD